MGRSVRHTWLFLFFSLLTFGESEPRPIVDREGRVITVLAGRPRDPTWDSVATDAAEAIRTAGEQLQFPHDQTSHRRGDTFTAGAFGYSYGGGQTVWFTSVFA